MNTRSTVLKIENLKKSYFGEAEEFKILKGIDLEVNQGDFISIMGPSGSGKSTLMHILGALDRPTFGSYKLQGRELANLTDDELSKVRNKDIGFVFQAFYLVPHNTVLQNVLLPSRYGGVEPVDSKIAVQLLEAIGLGERLHFKPNQISGGQCQRAAIARAIHHGCRWALYAPLAAAPVCTPREQWPYRQDPARKLDTMSLSTAGRCKWSTSSQTAAIVATTGNASQPAHSALENR